MNLKQPKKTTITVQLAFLFAIFCLVPALSDAQQHDTIVPVENHKKILRKIDIKKVARNGLNFWQDDFSGHFAGIDFGFNMFLNDDYSDYETEFMNNDVSRSNSAYFNFMQQSIGLQQTRNFIGIVTGMGLHLQSYRLEDNITIQKNVRGIVHPQELLFDQNQKSKLSVVSLTVPLLTEFQIPVNHYDNRIYISAGILGSIRLSSHSKIKYKANQKEKLKVEDDFSIHTFKYAVMCRAGYRWINVFATYDLVPFFKKDKGPELTPFTFGITLMRF